MLLVLRSRLSCGKKKKHNGWLNYETIIITCTSISSYLSRFYNTISPASFLGTVHFVLISCVLSEADEEWLDRREPGRMPEISFSHPPYSIAA